MFLVEEATMRDVAYWRTEADNVAIRWMDAEYTSAAKYYREVVMNMPKEDGIILGATEHLDAIARLSGCGLYVADTDESDIYVDDWRVNGRYLTHRHPEFGIIDSAWTKGMVEAELHFGSCGVCDKKIPGPIEMMHNFYRLNG
jgi:hypothetical protein